MDRQQEGREVDTLRMQTTLFKGERTSTAADEIFSEEFNISDGAG